MPDLTTTYPDPLPDIFLTGTINLLSGAPNVGKTTLIAWMATCFRDGLPIFGQRPPHPYWVGYVSADRPWESSRRVFTKAGFPDIPQFSFIDDTTITKAMMRDKYKRVEVLIKVLELLKVPDGGIVIVDPLARFLGNNLNDADLVSDCCRELHQYLIAHHLLLLGLMHASKQKMEKGDRYSNPFDQMSGSVSLQGHANTTMHLMAPSQSESGQHEFWWNSHHHPMEMFTLKRNEAGLFVTTGDDPTPKLPRKPIPSQCQALYVEFPDPPMTLDIASVKARFPDASEPTIFRWLKLLVDLEYLNKTEHGVYIKAKD